MPPTLEPNLLYRSIVDRDLLEKNLGYSYPSGLNLRPGSPLHKKIVEEVLARVHESHRYMSTKYDEWAEIDATLRAYVRPEALSKQKGSEQEDDLVRYVMPISYANLETLLTYMSAAFIQDPIFKYEGVGPEDTLGSMLLEKRIALDGKRFKHGLALHTHWRDGFTYGFGAISPIWTQRFGKRNVKRQMGYTDQAENIFIPTDVERGVEKGLLYEGNRLDNIDPYRFFPDPNVSIHEVQEGEYVCWADRTSYVAMLNEERDSPTEVFNVRYLPATTGKSAVIEHRQGRELSDANARVSTNSPVDIIWAYIDIVPRDWKLSKEKYPETWLFCVAADSIVISARPVGLNHGMKPVAIVAPDYDGYSCLPSSRMGIVKDMQTLVDFMYSSHVMNIRKAINDMIVVDPEMVNIWDLQNPGPGKIIRMRRSAWGRGTIDQAIKQLDIRDVTQNHVADADFLMSFMQKVLGSTDPATGHIVNKGPRISASQASQAKTSVLSRLEKTARIIDMQSHQDLAYMMASQMQQLMSEDTYVKAMGEWGQRLQADFGITPQSGRIPVSIFDLLIDYDIVSHTGSVPGSEDPDTWIAVLQMAGGIPPLAATLDWPRLFKHISRQMGAKNIDDFIMQTTPLVMPDEQVQSQVQQGNLVPANGIPS